MGSFTQHLHIPSQSYNLQTIRSSPLSELSGSLGDLGTLLPLMIALTVTGSISLPATLVFTGITNIMTGLVFGIPLPVQPMKAIAAVAISRSFTKDETASAGLFVGGVVTFLSLTGLLNWIGRVVPIPVIKGIQLGAGLSLVISAGTSQLQKLTWTGPSAGDNLIWALVAFLFLLACSSPATRSARGTPRVPFALIVLVIGLVIAITTRATGDSSLPFFFGAWHPRVSVPSLEDFGTGAFAAGLGQIPLTCLNSVIAVTHLSADLLPSRPAPAPAPIGLSVGLANLVCCWFSAMPVCHGSGGLAGQYKFGARSGASVVALGLLKLVLGLAVSDAWLIATLDRFPGALLGVMVLAAGLELARVAESLNAGARDLWEEAEAGSHPTWTGLRMALFEERRVDSGVTRRAREPDEQERYERWTVMMFTVALELVSKNTAIGFVAGLLCHWSFRTSHWWNELRRRREGQVPEESEGLLAGR